MAEFEINGSLYRNAAMDPMTQFHVMRRLMPLLTSFKEMEGIDDLQLDSEEQSVKKMVSMIEPIAMRLSELKDEDANYIIQKCLATCSRCADKVPHSGSPWAPIWPTGAQRPVYNDIDMFQMLRITYNVMLDQFANFLPAPPSRLSVIQGGA